MVCDSIATWSPETATCGDRGGSATDLPAWAVAGSTTATVLASLSRSSTFWPSWTTSSASPVPATIEFSESICVFARPSAFFASLATHTAASLSWRCWAL